jgi:hypothetical protein
MNEIEAEQQTLDPPEFIVEDTMSCEVSEEATAIRAIGFGIDLARMRAELEERYKDKSLLTSSDVADIFQVTQRAVISWADILGGIRTPGGRGRWRFTKDRVFDLFCRGSE